MIMYLTPPDPAPTSVSGRLGDAKSNAEIDDGRHGETNATSESSTTEYFLTPMMTLLGFGMPGKLTKTMEVTN